MLVYKYEYDEDQEEIAFAINQFSGSKRTISIHAIRKWISGSGKVEPKLNTWKMICQSLFKFANNVNYTAEEIAEMPFDSFIKKLSKTYTEKQISFIVQLDAKKKQERANKKKQGKQIIQKFPFETLCFSSQNKKIANYHKGEYLIFHYSTNDKGSITISQLIIFEQHDHLIFKEESPLGMQKKFIYNGYFFHISRDYLFLIGQEENHNEIVTYNLFNSSGFKTTYLYGIASAVCEKSNPVSSIVIGEKINEYNKENVRIFKNHGKNCYENEDIDKRYTKYLSKNDSGKHVLKSEAERFQEFLIEMSETGNKSEHPYLIKIKSSGKNLKIN